ncbi:YpoC family protein [Bacillus salitolerans]|uniref:YpoC family protein n=1 Tax=Bacillus salitolerans TaxID=1437434 RepID=A0ABW4LTV0_9BACI
MTSRINLLIPCHFQPSLFFNNKEWITINKGEELLYEPFLYDIAYYHKISIDKPWENNRALVLKLYDRWTEDKEILKLFFNNRNRQGARPYMIKSLGFFIMFICWSNQQPVLSITDWTTQVSRLPIKPVNMIERLNHIFTSPDHYHSYLQLTQLYEELNKQYQKSFILKQKETPK